MSDLEDFPQLLHAKTLEGKIKWHLDDDDRISTRQGESIIEIISTRSNAYVINLRGLNGTIIASEAFRRFEEMQYDTVSELFIRVKRDSLGIDKAIDDVKNRLIQL